MFGCDYVEYGKSCNNLVIVYDFLGCYEEVELLYLEVFVICVFIVGKESVIYVSVLVNLGGMYSSMGVYEKVEDMFLEVIVVCEKLLGNKYE